MSSFTPMPPSSPLNRSSRPSRFKHGKKIFWLVLVLLVLLGAVLMVRGNLAKKKVAQSSQVEMATKAAEQGLELIREDWIYASRNPLTQTIALSGNVRAVESASLKAKVAGEITHMYVKEGATVKTGQVLAEIEATEYKTRLEQATRQTESAKAQMEIAQRNFENNQALVKQGFISATALETSRANLEGAKGTLDAATGTVSLMQKALTDTKIIAPFSGTIATRLMQVGERVNIDARVLELVNLESVEFEVAFSPEAVSLVRVGQRGTFTVQGIAQPVRAEVVRISPSIVAGTQSIRAYLRATTHNPALRQGLYAQGVLEIARLQTQSIPWNSVHFEKPEPYVQVLEEVRPHPSMPGYLTGIVAHRKVTIGIRGSVNGEDFVAVSGAGLAENSIVLGRAVDTLPTGTRMRWKADIEPPAKR